MARGGKRDADAFDYRSARCHPCYRALWRSLSVDRGRLRYDSIGLMTACATYGAIHHSEFCANIRR
jgi:hypothetical protein